MMRVNTKIVNFFVYMVNGLTWFYKLNVSVVKLQEGLYKSDKYF